MSVTKNILDPTAIVAVLPTLLPPSQRELTSPQDSIAALVHAIFSAVGFRLLATDETSPALDFAANVLPIQWNKEGPEKYTFRYKHKQSSLEFALRISKLTVCTMINTVAVETGKVESLNIKTNDFLSSSLFPLNIDRDGQSSIHGFISSGCLEDMISRIKIMLVQKLIPGLQKEGYTEEDTDFIPDIESSRGPRTTNSATAHPEDYFPPLAPESAFRPYHIPSQNPLEIGRRDLDPFPSNPFVPPYLFPRSPDGMYVGPDHPIFQGRGPWGGDGFLPPLGAPPRARFDPIGPGPLPGRGGISGTGRESGNNDEFLPPGMGHMFI